MKNKRLLSTIFAVFVTIFITDWIVHGALLGKAYHATAHLWRSEAEMQKHMHFMFLGQFFTAVFFSWIFTFGYEKKKGMGEGVRYGLLMSGFMASQIFVTYAVTPLPMNIFISWIAAAVGQCVLAGIAATVVHQNVK